jgi:hypothetical protein
MAASKLSKVEGPHGSRPLFLPTGPTSPAETIDAAPWTWDSPYWLTATIITFAVIVILVLFGATPTAHGEPVIVTAVHPCATGNAVPSVFDGPLTAKHRIEAEYVKSPSVRWPTGPVAIHGTDIVWVDTKGKKPWPAASIPELIAKGQAKERELSLRIDEINKEIRSIYILLIGSLVISLVWVSRISDAVTYLKFGKGGAKSCRPSQVSSSQH